MNKVITFSLWGAQEKYTLGAIENADIAMEIYPGWTCRYYVAKSTPTSIVRELASRKNTEIFIMNSQGDWTSMFWRFYAASDPLVDYMISRDTDSRVSKRESAAVEAWINSGKAFHIMRDHPRHAIEILGGMWGAKRGSLVPMVEMIKQFMKKTSEESLFNPHMRKEGKNYYQVDQHFLRDMVYPIIKDDSIIHDPIFENKPFPTRRGGLEYVGAPIEISGEVPADMLKELLEFEDKIKSTKGENI